MRYVELAVNAPVNRGRLLSLGEYENAIIPKDNEYLSGNKTLFRSTYVYDQEAKEYVDKNKTLKNYHGPRYIDLIPIDIDKGDNWLEAH